jgi:hypothetical protein
MHSWAADETHEMPGIAGVLKIFSGFSRQYSEPQDVGEEDPVVVHDHAPQLGARRT